MTRRLERSVAAGERLVRVPPKLTAPQRRTGRRAGSRPDRRARCRAGSVAGAAARSTRARRGALRELKLLVDHRDDLVAERPRPAAAALASARARPGLDGPARRARPVGLARPARPPARPPRADQPDAIVRELVGRCRTPDPHDPGARTRAATTDTAIAPAARAARLRHLMAAKLLCEIGPIDRFPTDAQLARHAGVAPLDASPANTNATGSTAAATANSTAPSTGSRSPRPRPPTRPRLPGPQTDRRQEPPRSNPLPQTTTRPHHLHHPQKRAPLT